MAVLDSEDYSAKLDLIVSDISKFVEIFIKQHETHVAIKKNSISYYSTFGNV